jgi:3-oxoacid CoA-transferase subunit A
MRKIFKDIRSALEDIVFDGMTIMVGGFGLCGIPENAIKVLQEIGVKDLTIISNNFGVEEFGLDILLAKNQIRKLVASYIAGNKNIQQKYISGEIELELTPQGSLAEKIRAGGAGIPAFYTQTGVGTIVGEGKEVREFDGKKYLMERALTADLALVKAYIGDHEGNLIYSKTTRNFNPIMATAAKFTVAEVERLVEIGKIDPDNIHTPGIYVKRIVEVKFEKRIENLTLKEN